MVLQKRKQCVRLEDYCYHRDIDLRLFISQLSPLEVTVLKEIIASSLQFSLVDFSIELDLSPSCLFSILDKLNSQKLLNYDGTTVWVDKEWRKHFEFQLSKFDPTFESDIMNLFAHLKNVPLDVLLNWYEIPRTSDNIFDSLIQAYFVTPKTYERHLQDVCYEDPIIGEIIEELYSSDHYKIDAKKWCEKQSISQKAFEELLLTCEFKFVCYLCYEWQGECWKQVITPLAEWCRYQHVSKMNIPDAIKDQSTIDISNLDPFFYIRDLKCIKECFPEKQWHSATLEEKASKLFLLPNPFCLLESNTSPINTPLNLRRLEKDFRRILNHEWVYFDDFICCLESDLGSADSVLLKKRGKQWDYVFPEYTKEEIAWIEEMIFNLYRRMGVVLTGTHEGRPCFTLTDVGCRLIKNRD